MPGVRDLLPLAAARPERYPALLESVAPGPRSRWDILFAFPDERLICTPGAAPGFLDAVDGARRRRGLVAAAPEPLPFLGGWLLYLGYELAAGIEPTLALPAAASSVMPTALALHCPAAVLVDRLQGCTWLVAEAGYAARLAALQRDLEDVPAGADAPPLPRIGALHEEDPDRFLRGVARVHAYLCAGDTFQVNLSRGWCADFATPPPPAVLYAALRSANPAPFAALLQQPGWAVASSSPERLLAIRGAVATTQPIAGTRPRDEGIDGLRASAKERAEHVMLVDLERNDLGRVAVPGSVCVDRLMQVESYTHVHHLVSSVSARLRAGVTAGQAIAALFPGGTITGCPKVRCMQIIAELERTGRGAYTGSLGYLSNDGGLDLNILIRTMTLERQRVAFRAGAGIVVDSDARRELAETRAKARGMLAALGQA
ncbi:MAG TPA: aminodeoxychorismate synthase component I [Rhodanobacteraceae bacterium]|nr:aminodeoxychorismate synthase component I [Rhodanobacteraceae bacterium]